MIFSVPFVGPISVPLVERSTFSRQRKGPQGECLSHSSFSPQSINMPGKMMSCVGCSKVMRSDNLKRHQKICKGCVRTEGKGLSLPLLSVPYSKKNSDRKKLIQILKDAGDPESDDESNKSGGRDKLIQILQDAGDPEIDAESDESGDDDISTEEDNYGLWEKFVMSCNRGTSKDIFEWLARILPLYQWSKKDDLVQTLMQDVEDAKEKGCSLRDSFNYAVNNNKDDIVAATMGDTDGFWASLRDKFPMPLECKWLTGDVCHCEGCFGNSLLTKVRHFLEIFYGMGVDDTIQNILDDDGHSPEELIERHKDEINEKFQKASKLIEECGIIDDPKRPKFRTECKI